MTVRLKVEQDLASFKLPLVFFSDLTIRLSSYEKFNLSAVTILSVYCDTFLSSLYDLTADLKANKIGCLFTVCTFQAPSIKQLNPSLIYHVKIAKYFVHNLHLCYSHSSEQSYWIQLC